MECIYEQFLGRVAESEDLQASAAKRSPEQWKEYIREQLYDLLPTFFGEEYIRSLPQHKQGVSHENRSTGVARMAETNV